MGNKKIVVILIIIIVLLLGWLLAFKSVTRMDEIRKQNSLIEKADNFSERELYLRAIPLYEEAMQIKTTNKKGNEVEAKLLNAYYSHGDYDKYADLVEKRVKDDTASIEEYKKTFNYYVDNYNIKDGFILIKKGISQTGDQELSDLYEDYRYEYSRRTTKCTYIEPTGANRIMPSFDGEKWGFVSSDGRPVLPNKYDSVTAFSNDGIAAVSLEGKYYTINTQGDKYGADDNDSNNRIQEVLYTAGNMIVAKRDDKYGLFDYDFNLISNKYIFDEMTRPSNGLIVGRIDSEWIVINASDDKIIMKGIEDVAVNSYGSVFCDDRGMIKINGAWHLVDKDGKDILSNITFEDAKAPESDEYIAVSDKSGRWGFINSKGEVKIDYQFLDAYSFSDYVAAVQKYNGYWVYIDRFGQEISGDQFDEAKPFHEGSAQIYLEGAVELIQFKNYDLW